MAPGLEQCMYCGEDEGTDIDHFEPLARNPLRTFDWLNHLLACSTCNSHNKRNQFPLDADDQPLLIDPTAEDPFDHLLLTLSLGHYEPLTTKGKATIEVCELNRPLLERGRVRSRRVVNYCVRAWASAHRESNAKAMAEAVTTVQEQPFADVCQAMLRQAQSPGAEIVFSDSPEILALLRDPELRDALLSR
ncbi:MAG TPA: HNH endonuclease [Trebonia sp.]|nr:HNH endonuclease [Trebonia sp.]